MSHIGNVNTGMENLTIAKGTIEDDKKMIQKYIEKIPKHNGQKDELGSNIEESINEILKRIDDELINNVNEVLGKKSNFERNANEKDQPKSMDS